MHCLIPIHAFNSHRPRLLLELSHTVYGCARLVAPRPIKTVIWYAYLCIGLELDPPMSVLKMASAQACADSPPAAFLSLLSSVITGHFLTDCDTCRFRGTSYQLSFHKCRFFLPTQEFLAELRPSPVSSKTVPGFPFPCSFRRS